MNNLWFILHNYFFKLLPDFGGQNNHVENLRCRFPAPISQSNGVGVKSAAAAAAAAKSLQSCRTLCDPIDGGPPGSPVPGILQARTLEWVAISFSNE